MNDCDMDYLVPDGTGLETIRDLLQVRCRFLEEPTRTLSRTFFDTFDWALFARDATLEERRSGSCRMLVLQDLHAESLPSEQGTDGAPGFGWDLPPGPVRERVAPIVGVRCLLPLLHVETESQTLRLLDEDDKTVARVVVERNRFDDPTRERRGALSARLHLLSVKGYVKEYKAIARTLEQDLGLDAARTPLILEALAAAGRQPGAYSSKLDYHLDPGRRADASTKEILMGLLATLEANIAGTRANLDSEFLHDLRVATRRTRSALTQIKDVFPSQLVEGYKERFAWLQQITGPVRDLDVYLLDFDGYQRSLPPALRCHLEPLREFLLAHYEEEQRNLAEALDSQQFRDLLDDWRTFLEAPVPERSAVPNAMRATKELADDRIWRMYKRVLKEGRAIEPGSPAEDLHDLRKSCKKLRYLLEFFSSLYPKNEISVLIKLLKNLLDNLGRFQDLAVQADSLRAMAQRMRDEGRAETDTLLTMGVLVGDLLIHQQRAREEFADIFAGFNGKKNRVLFERLFAAGIVGGKAA